MASASLKKLFDTGNHSTVASVGLFILRALIGVQMVAYHGIGKALDFSAKAPAFPDPLQIGGKYSLMLTTFAEVGCALLIVLGFATRLAAVPLAVAMGVAAIWYHLILQGHALEKTELPLLYLAGAIALVFLGPGRISLDHMITRK